MGQLRAMAATRDVLSKASHTPSLATITRAPLLGSRTCGAANGGLRIQLRIYCFLLRVYG